MEKKVVILTKSSKFSGYCIAGVDYKTGSWIRLVSNNCEKHGALSINDICYMDGSICNPLDIVLVDVEQAAPTAHQPENYLITSGACWTRIGKSTLLDVLRVHPAENYQYQYLYGNTASYVEENMIDDIDHSLTLIKVSNLTIHHITNSLGKPKTKASFIYNNNEYSSISVTDPDYYSIPTGTTFVQAHLIVSLPDTSLPVGCYYKFIAKIFT